MSDSHALSKSDAESVSLTAAVLIRANTNVPFLGLTAREAMMAFIMWISAAVRCLTLIPRWTLSYQSSGMLAKIRKSNRRGAHSIWVLIFPWRARSLFMRRAFRTSDCRCSKWSTLISPVIHLSSEFLKYGSGSMGIPMF